MILVAGPYRSGTDGDPARIAANVEAMTRSSLDLYRRGHLPVMGEWFALPLIEQADAQGDPGDPDAEIFHPDRRAGPGPLRRRACASAARRRGRTGWSPRARRLGKTVYTSTRGGPVTRRRRSRKSEMMIVAAARALEGQRVCFVGVGLPNIAVNLAQRTVAPDLELVYEAGVFGARPPRLPLSIGDPTIVTGSTAVVSMLELFGYYLQGGLIDVGFLGAAQIDRFGNINTTVIGDYDAPDDAPARVSGGACEIAINARQVFVIMRQSRAQLRRDASTSGRSPATSAAPSRPSASGARAAGWAAARRSSSPTSASTTSTRPARCASTRCTRARPSRRCARRSAGRSRSPTDLATTPPPTAEELRLVREELDPGASTRSSGSGASAPSRTTPGTRARPRRRSR